MCAAQRTTLGRIVHWDDLVFSHHMLTVLHCPVLPVTPPRKLSWWGTPPVLMSKAFLVIKHYHLSQDIIRYDSNNNTFTSYTLSFFHLYLTKKTHILDCLIQTQIHGSSVYKTAGWQHCAICFQIYCVLFSPCNGFVTMISILLMRTYSSERFSNLLQSPN